MTRLKEQAFEILQGVPDDKMIHVIELLRGLSGLFGMERTVGATTVSADDIPALPDYGNMSSAEAWKGFQKYIGIIDCDIDYKAELAKARDEKYADFL